MKYIYCIFIFLVSVLSFVSCKKKHVFPQLEFVTAFKSSSINFNKGDTEKTLELVYSFQAKEDGFVKIKYTSKDLQEGIDFSLEKSSESGEITLPIKKGGDVTKIKLKKLKEPDESVSPLLIFEIVEINYPNSKIQGNSQLTVSFIEGISSGTQIAPEVGGPNQGNQVYVDLTTEKTTIAVRDSWDLAFYSDNDQFRVKINNSIYMAVADLGITDMTTVNESQLANLKQKTVVGSFDPDNLQYIDSPDGDINKTAIDAIASDDLENNVYLLNLGYEIGTSQPNPGGVEIAGKHRSWKKIRILRSNNDYILQYADLDDIQYKSVVINKTDGYNFTFFSFNTESIVNVEPLSSKWQICFTVFTNEIEGNGSYGYSDFVVSNRLGGVSGYKVDGDKNAYNNFTPDDINQNNFTEDQRFIGDNWRLGGGPGYSPSLKDNVFFILKDGQENIYKIRFTALVNQDGNRGYPSFEYKLLN